MQHIFELVWSSIGTFGGRTNSGKDFVKVEEIRRATELSSDSFTTYRKRLMDAGILDGKQYGYLRFRLPEFERYIERLTLF